MKQVILFAAMLLMVSVSYGQAKAKPKPPVKATPAKPFVLKNAEDSFYYAMGLSVGSFCAEQGLTKIKTANILKGVGDAFNKDSKPLLTPQQMNMAISGYLGRVNAEKAAVARETGRKWLEENAKKPGVVTLPSGLQYQVIKAGADTAHPKATDQVRVHYHGTLITGEVFDSSVDRGEPATFRLNEVVSGWTQAIQLMTVGAKWKVFLPSNLGYGDRANGPIPAGATLVFDIELLEILKN